jgi:hypothetical protein
MTPIRPYQPFDVTWLLPIAEKYGEALAFLGNLKHVVAGWVIEPKAALFLYRDPHGLAVAGITDEHGIRSMVALCRAMRSVCKEFITEPLHGHADPGTWQYRMFEQLGFRNHNGIMRLEG